MPQGIEHELLAAAHAAADAGLVVGSVGNLSARVRDRCVISTSGARLASLSAGQLTELDITNGEIVAGRLRPSSESGLHLAIYRNRPDARAILHTHAPWSTAVACAVDELPCIHYQMLALGGAVRVAPYRCFGTQALATVTLTALEGRRAVLMSNHGATVYAESPTAALEAMQVLEFACALYWRAAQLGTPRLIDPHQWQDVAAQVRHLDYGITHALGRGSSGDRGSSDSTSPGIPAVGEHSGLYGKPTGKR